MKSRILTALLVLSIIITCSITFNNINAAGSYKIEITASSQTVKYGDEVTVEFQLKDITLTPRSWCYTRKNPI